MDTTSFRNYKEKDEEIRPRNSRAWAVLSNRLDPNLPNALFSLIFLFTILTSYNGYIVVTAHATFTNN